VRWLLNAKTGLIACVVLLGLLAYFLTFQFGPTRPSGTHTNPADTTTTKETPGGSTGGKVAVPPLTPLEEEDAKNNSGLSLTIESVAKPGLVDRRLARIPSLFVPEGTPPTAFIPPGPFKATWEGDLKVDIKDDYIFAAEGSGKLSIVINKVEAYAASGADFATTVGKKVKLGKGKNHVLISYESPAKGDAMVRLNWRSAEIDANDGFFPESLAPNRLSFDKTNTEFRESVRVHKGRELYGTLRCEACHGSEHSGANLGKDAMPELTMDAPNLSEAGKRLNTAWIATWLKDPRKLRNESSMPQLLRGPTADKDAEDIAGYLSTLGAKDEPADEKPTEEAIKKAGYTFTSFGCVGCHVLPNSQKQQPGRVMLAYVRDKWKPAALREFLKKPDAHYAWIRMPDFRFTDEEIKDISTFVLNVPISDEGKGEPIAALKNKPDIEHGKALVESLGCLNCHNAGPSVASKSQGKAFKEFNAAAWTKGCLSEKEEGLGKAPNFHLDAEQRGALLAFAATDRSSLQRESLPEFAERQVASMRCTVCHNRDGKQSFWAPEENEINTEQEAFLPPENAAPDGAEGAGEGKVKQHIPSITWVGEKLKPEWAAKFIDGKMDYKPRIWLKARMPGFHSRAALIAKGLAIEHGYPTVNPAPFVVNPELAEIGSKIVATNGGFACGQCHTIGGDNVRSKQAFEWPAINFKYFQERLMQPFYYKWMNEPTRMEPGTGMTAFSKGGDNQKTEFFDGKGHKQFEAIWHYLQTGREIKSPNPETE